MMIAARVQGLGKYLLCLCLILSGAAQANDQADYEARMQELQKTIEQLQQELKKTQGSRDELKEQLESSESDIGELLKKIERIESDLEQQNSDLQSLKQERNELDQSRQAQQQAVAEQVQAAYALGRQSQIKLLLNQESPQRAITITGWKRAPIKSSATWRRLPSWIASSPALSRKRLSWPATGTN